MVEFTESEPLRSIEEYAQALKEIAEQAYNNPAKAKEAPKNTSARRVDDVYANHPKSVTPTYRVYLRRLREDLTL